MNQKKIVVVGAGVMGKMIASSIAFNFKQHQVFLTAKTTQKAKKVRREVGEQVNIGNNEEVRSADVVILAIKPGSRQEFYKEYGKSMKDNALLISIMAGVSISELQEKMHPQVVRAMTNIALEHGQAVTVWKAMATGPALRRFVDELFLTWGKVFYTKNEDDIDKATALFGSGPALVYYFAESLYEAGLLIGFPKHRLAELVAQMIAGSFASLEQTKNVNFANSRDDVSSSGGTTVEGVAVLDEKGVRFAIKTAIRAIYRKCLKL